MTQNMKKFWCFIALVCASITFFQGCGKTSGGTVIIPTDDPDPEKPDVPQPGKAVVGKEVPSWVKGCFDIHFVNTQQGECTFLIFPDGTQMIIDAAGCTQKTGAVSSSVANDGIRKRWSDYPIGESCNKFIAEYINKCMGWTGNNKIDYALLTHLHNDHYGAHYLDFAAKTKMPASTNSSTFVQQSFVYILDNYSIGKLLDRGYPDYNYPFDMNKLYSTSSESSVKNWITAVKWHVANNGLKVEKIKAGSNDQIVMNKATTKDYAFSVRNIGVNGDVWTGVGTGYASKFPALADITCTNPPSVENNDKCPEENHESAVLKFTYGAFDYWAGGDMQYDGVSSFSWKDIETPMAQACGEVDVMKADHHGCSNTNGFGNKGTALKYLKPTCWIVNSWTDGHPRQATFEGVTDLIPELQVFITNTCDSQKKYKNYASTVKGADGHVVVRVMPGGSTYYVYVLTDSDHKMTVKSVSGPYKSK